jgi:archaellin
MAVLEEAELDAQVEQDDDGQIAHDEPVVKTLRDEAIELMEQMGVEMTTEEEEVALNVFPKVLDFNSMLLLLLITNNPRLLV